MKRATMFSILVICAAVLRILLSPSGTAEQSSYNPYPPGILPPDLPSEIDRVGREVRVIENEALAQSRALPPPTLTGQPPTLQGTGMRPTHLPGKPTNFDENISPFK